VPTVLDASALVAFLMREPAAHVVGEAVARGDAQAPTLIGVETMSAIMRMERRGVVDAETAHEAAAVARGARISLVPDRELLARAWTLRHNVTAYDALYVALAEHLGCPLMTTDRRLARAVEETIAVTLIPETAG